VSIPLLHSLVGNPIKWVKKDGSRHTEPHPCDPCGSRLWCAQGGTDDRFRVAHDYVQRVIAALARRINGVQVEETPYGVFCRELTQAQLQQVTDRVPYRTVKAWHRTWPSTAWAARAPSTTSSKGCVQARTRTLGGDPALA
jgi:hypothetical protein